MLIQVHGAPDEEALNVVVRTIQAEEGIGRLESVARNFGKLADL